jgi:hypothetical protein
MKIPAKVNRRPTAPRPSRLVSIDPGTTHSAFMRFNPRSMTWDRFGKVPNAIVLTRLFTLQPEMVVCEDMQAMGRPCGAEVFATVRYTGRIQQICFTEGIPFHLIKRTTVKKFLCPKMRAKDKDVRAAMIALYGPQGSKKEPGRTYGIANDVWSAFAIAHVFTETVLKGKPV